MSRTGHAEGAEAFFHGTSPMNADLCEMLFVSHSARRGRRDSHYFKLSISRFRLYMAHYTEIPRYGCRGNRHGMTLECEDTEHRPPPSLHGANGAVQSPSGRTDTKDDCLTRSHGGTETRRRTAFSIFHFPFSIFHFPFSIFHFPFSIQLYADPCEASYTSRGGTEPFCIFNFQFSIFNFQFNVSRDTHTHTNCISNSTSLRCPPRK